MKKEMQQARVKSALCFLKYFGNSSETEVTMVSMVANWEKRGEEKIFLSENTDGIVLLTSQNLTVQCCCVSLTHPIQQIFAALSFISQQLSAFLIPDRKRFVKEVVLRI